MEHGHLVCKLTTLLHQQYLQLILQTQLAHSAGWELDIKQWGRVGLPIDGGSHAVPLQIMVNKIFVALVSMVSPDVPDIVMAPYWTNADANNIYITTDYETGHSYSGQGQNVVAWILISE